METQAARDLTARPDLSALDQVCRGMVETLSRTTARHFVGLAKDIGSAELVQHVHRLDALARDGDVATAASARFIGLLFVGELERRVKRDKSL